MSVSSKPKKMIIRFRSGTPEETFHKNTEKAKAARTERPPEDFGAPAMGLGVMAEQENNMSNESTTFRLTVGELKRIINEEISLLNEAVNDDAPVKAVQAAMNMLGYADNMLGRPLKVDGIYGKNTYDTVKGFQLQSDALRNDGRVGPNTAEYIQSALISADAADSSAAVGESEPGDEDKAEIVTDPRGMTKADADEWLKRNAELPAGRKPVKRIRTSAEYIESLDVVEKIEAAGNDKSRFKSPVAAGAALKSFADQGDRELLAALRDMAERGGKRVSLRTKKIAQNFKKVLAKAQPENRQNMRDAFVDKLKADSLAMSHQLGIDTLSPYRPPEKPQDLAESATKMVNEYLDPSGDPAYTPNVVHTLMQKVRDKGMILRRKARKKPALKVAPPAADPPAVGAGQPGDPPASPPKKDAISEFEIGRIARFLSNDAFGQFNYPSSDKVDPKQGGFHPARKEPDVWVQAKADIDRVVKAGQIQDLKDEYQKAEGTDLADHIQYWLRQAKKQSRKGHLDLHANLLKSIDDDVDAATKKHNQAMKDFGLGPAPE